MEDCQREDAARSNMHSVDSTRELLAPTETSMLFSILPAALKARIPSLPSLGRPPRSCHIRRQTCPSSKPYSGASTPEHGYTSAIVLSRPDHLGERVTGYFDGSVSSDEDHLQVAAPHDGTQQSLSGKPDTGILWKFANQGILFLLGGWNTY
jgi:hypothetical protein